MDELSLVVRDGSTRLSVCGMLPRVNTNRSSPGMQIGSLASPLARMGKRWQVEVGARPSVCGMSQRVSISGRLTSLGLGFIASRLVQMGGTIAGGYGDGTLRLWMMWQRVNISGQTTTQLQSIASPSARMDTHWQVEAMTRPSVYGMP